MTRDGATDMLRRDPKGDRFSRITRTRPRRSSPVWCFLLTLLATSAAAGKYAGGSGTLQQPYLIETAQQLQQIGLSPEDWDSHFKLTAHVDMSTLASRGAAGFNIIGYLRWQPYDSRPFRGIFDGNGKNIANLIIRCSGRDYVGMFGYVNGPDAHIRNIVLVNASIEAEAGVYVGALVGNLKSGRISNCTVEGGAVSGNNCVGGLIGYNWQGGITECRSTASVTGNIDVGGLCGYQGTQTIFKCGSAAPVYGNEDVGGLAGESDGQVVSCYSLSEVWAQTRAGGLLGSSRGQILSSFARGRVTGYDQVAGLVGRNGGLISNCYARATTWGLSYTGGIAGLLEEDGIISTCYWVFQAEEEQNDADGIIGWGNQSAVAASFWAVETIGQMPAVLGPYTPEEMRYRRTFTDAGWDFVGERKNGRQDIWDICDGTDYPKLAWEIPIAGDIACPDGVDQNDLVMLCSEWLQDSLRADVAGETGDGFVDLIDWAVFATAWKSTPDSPYWNPRCDIAPDGGDLVVDAMDLGAFVQNWLQEGFSPPDVAGTHRNGQVDFADWAIFAAAWGSAADDPRWDARCDIWPDAGDGSVDMNDTAAALTEWLWHGPSKLAGDVAPEPKGDGFVDMLDLAVLARNWMKNAD